MANLMWRLGNGGMPAAQAYVVQIGGLIALLGAAHARTYVADAAETVFWS